MKNIIYIIIIVIAVGMFIGRDSKSSSSSTQNSSGDNSTMAYVQAKNFVRPTLKSPSTAKFPFSGSGISVGDSSYKVNSYVDSQNSFGAMIRTNYSITLRYNGGDSANQGNWSVLEAIVGDVDYTDSLLTEKDRRLRNCIDRGETRQYCLDLEKVFGTN